MTPSSPSSAADPAPLQHALRQSTAVTAEVQHASDHLAVVGTVLEQNLPEEVQVGDVAQALSHTVELEKKLAASARSLAEVNAVLEEEIEKRTELTERLDEAHAMVEKLVSGQPGTSA
ncbi:MAG: hypothetical protein EOO24_19945 [Comamonadaceae bacterium]|nr:MAG: hypothetical protein EOO24_19945 [Comamonadaceae bacterium]